MNFEITSGKIAKAQKICIYGPEGVGKSSFAAQFPDPIFIDTEGSTGGMNVRRLPKPTSWAMFGEEINYILQNKPCKSLIIDTIDWAEQLCVDYILGKHGKSGIEDFGYGNGYVYEKEEFSRFLNKTEELISAGINVVLTAHAQTRKFSQPDEIGEYDRWELKLGKKTGSQISPLVKEWADLLLFANYKTVAVAVDKDGKKFKAQGGTTRIMYTEHHACWDAKNRHGLKAELPFDFGQIAHIFTTPTETIPTVKYWFDGEKGYETTGEMPKSERAVFEITESEYIKIKEAEAKLEATCYDVPFTMSDPEAKPDIPDGIPAALADLMTRNNVSEAEISKVVSLRGYFPEGTPIKNYPSDFINGVLIAAWEQVFTMIKQQRREISNLPK